MVGRGGGGVVGDARLGGKVDVGVGGVFFAQLHHAQIRRDKGVHAGVPRVPDGLGQAGQLVVGGQGVQRQVDLFAAGVGKDAALGQLAGRKVGGRGAHAELLQGAVDGVGAVEHRVFQRFQVARRAEQFRL